VPVALFARFPSLRAPAQPDVLVPPDVRAEHAALADDFALLDGALVPAFDDLDVRALHEQHRYRRQKVVILIGSALTTGLGGLQAVYPDERWPGILLALIGVVTATAAHLTHEGKSLDGYLDARVKAERLRGIYFRFLSATGPYVGPGRGTRLEQDVAAVLLGKDPGPTAPPEGVRRHRSPDAAVDERARQAHRLYEEHRVQAQRRFYEARSKEYRRAREQAVMLSSLLLAAATLTGVVAVLTAGTARALMGVAGALLAALAAAVTGYESLMAFGQLAKLYEDAAANLRLAAAGSAEPAWSSARFGRRVDRVERVFRLESGQWGQLTISAFAELPPDPALDDVDDGEDGEDGDGGEAHGGGGPASGGGRPSP
jgi:hypothetical protein